MNNAPTYQELKRERDELMERVAKLEETVAELRERLERYTPMPHQTPHPTTVPQLSLDEKVALFRSLFRGREDVFARRWQSHDGSKSGYQPVCINEWKPQLCDKRRYKCAECPNRQFAPLTDADVYRHLEGRSADCRDVIGLYVINNDNTCHFLCADFDDKNCEHGFRGDVKAFVGVCRDWGVPCSVERSRSGNGAHIWIFFESPIRTGKARQLGNAILTEAMNRNALLTFKSYDRFFPNQDNLPDGGFGNLVALPLQGQARRQGNSVFIDEDFEPYPGQWSYLQRIEKLNENKVDQILQLHGYIPALGSLSTTSESKPWEPPTPPTIERGDFLSRLTIVKSNALFIPIGGLSAKVVNHLKRIASFRNPEFYSKQAMRFSTYNVPRIITCAEIIGDYLALPRGCEDAVRSFLEEKDMDFELVDKTNHGVPIAVTFSGALRDDQQEAVNTLREHSTGVLSATTAYGKTVAAIGMIAYCRVNALILVHTKALLDQWKLRLEEFLKINYQQEDDTPRRGRKKKWSPIGTLSSSGDSLHGIIDIALLQSCVADGEVKPFVKDYGMVIVDECHHVSAVNFERVLSKVTASRVYGLTATPIRKDGLQPIVFMQCGPIRYIADLQHQIANQSFARILVPRFTAYRSVDDENSNYAHVIQMLAEDEYRNKLIANDVQQALAENRSPIVLTSLTAHVETLSEMLQPHCKNVITLVGAESQKEKRLKMEQLQLIADNEPLVIVATGKYIGEGFDFPRLDTLFLALPVSWKGIIAQYAGRLHRDHEGKSEVSIYDYIDINVPLCETMYHRRLKGYAGIGYSLKPQGLFADMSEPTSRILEGQSFLTPFLRNLSQVQHSIVIACPKVRPGRQSRIMARLLDLAPQGIRITIVTREQNEHTDHLKLHGTQIVINENLTLNCAIFDRTAVWYGNVSILGYHNPNDNIITFHDSELATIILYALYK